MLSARILSDVEPKNFYPENVYIKDGYITLDISYPYNIKLDRCDTPEKILHWIEHLTRKTWINTLALNKFIQLAFGQIGIKSNKHA